MIVLMELLKLKTPLISRGVFFIFLGIIFSVSAYSSLGDLTPEDYKDQLSFLGHQYVKNSSIKRLTKFQRHYLLSLYKRIRKNNKRFLPLDISPSFFVIRDENPFYFSLPNNFYFFSSGLIEKYFKNEQTLISCLSFMMLQAHNASYIKKIVVPIGYISTDQMISLINLPLDMKAELNKAVFFVLKNMGKEGSYYLQWLQLQNRNTLDFSRQIGDPQFITKEEFLFKQFISKRINRNFNLQAVSNNSSRQFYKFIRGFR